MAESLREAMARAAARTTLPDDVDRESVAALATELMLGAGVTRRA